MQKTFKDILNSARQEKGRPGRQVQIKPKKARIMGVFSCKGGVGKTTIAVNLATFLNEKVSNDVIVVEANFTAPNVALHLGVVDPPITMHDVLAGRTSIERAINVSSWGLHYIPGSIAISEEIYLVDLKSSLAPLKKKYKYIILDSAPGLGPEVISAVKASDELLVVTNPEVPTIATTLRTFRAAERYMTPVRGVVVNKVRGKGYEVPIPEIRKTLKWPIASVIHDDDKVRESLTAGMPVIRYASNSSASKKFRELGEHLLAEWNGHRKHL